ncbi:MAG: TRAP transporter small permease [Eubacteriales bacterium]|nr:TRAP transporter small permease [Eubacteriales bacterium]
MKDKPKLLVRLLNLDFILSGAAFILLVLVTFIGVIMRYLFNNPLVWQEEMQLSLVIWVVFFGASAAFRTGGHVAIEIIVDSMPAKVRYVVEILGYLVTCVVLLYLLKSSMNLVLQMVTTGRATNILRVPYELIYGAFPVSCVLMVVNYTYSIYHSHIKPKPAEEAEDEH